MSTISTILKKLFHKTDREPPATRRGSESGALPSAPVCPFCGERAAQVACTPAGEGRCQPAGGYQSFATRHLGHTFGLWACSCTAVGSGAWGPDLDEAVALVQETLGLELTEAQVEHLRRFERDHFDHGALLKEMFRLHQFELRRHSDRQGEGNFPWLWVRKTVP